MNREGKYCTSECVSATGGKTEKYLSGTLAANGGLG
jgi:hypothetical protein